MGIFQYGTIDKARRAADRNRNNVAQAIVIDIKPNFANVINRVFRQVVIDDDTTIFSFRRRISSRIAPFLYQSVRHGPNVGQVLVHVVPIEWWGHGPPVTTPNTTFGRKETVGATRFHRITELLKPLESIRSLFQQFECKGVIARGDKRFPRQSELDPVGIIRAVFVHPFFHLVNE
jgi:hypothetical protein